MIQHSPDILQDLLIQWTKVDIDEGDDFKPSSTRLRGQTSTSTAGTTISDAPGPDLDDSDSSSDGPLFIRRNNGPGDYVDESHRKEPPSFSRRTVPTLARSQTMPAVPPSSRKDEATPRAIKLKNTETRDSGGSDRSERRYPVGRRVQRSKPPGATEDRTVDPSDTEDHRRPTATKTKQSSTKYQIIDPSESEDDGRPWGIAIDPNEPEGYRRGSEIPYRQPKEAASLSVPHNYYQFDNSSSNPRTRRPRSR
jgi:hypothetical protein